jgi:hypothetical protein
MIASDLARQKKNGWHYLCAARPPRTFNPMGVLMTMRVGLLLLLATLGPAAQLAAAQTSSSTERKPPAILLVGASGMIGSRLLVVGGAGRLNFPDGRRVVDSLPQSYQAEALAMRSSASWKSLRTCTVR